MPSLSWPFVLILHEAGVRNYLVFLMKETPKINKASPLSAENTQYSGCSDALVMQRGLSLKRGTGNRGMGMGNGERGTGNL